MNQHIPLPLQNPQLQPFKPNQTSPSFKPSIHTQTAKLPLQHLTLILTHIQLFPKNLPNSPNLNHFPTFKPLLNPFLKHTLHNPLNIQTSTTFHIYPNTPTLPLLKPLHHNLIQLTHQII
ncbi:DUF327 family protein, partial [Bacillus sp. WP8]|uniref:DUF327 family protein n=1 Tax=Bacillus sp. WP8 TaxID=756828 RepID=UPI0011A3F147